MAQEKGLVTLAKKKLITIANGILLNLCEHCLFEKQHGVVFQSSKRKRSELLSLVHFDVCSPIEEESLGGNRYFVTFINDASRKVWMYVLKTKDQVVDHFKQFHDLMERKIGKKLKCLRTDNGGEYTSHEFRSYCANRGIRYEKIVPRTPLYNGITKRMNRTIVEKVRCLLIWLIYLSHSRVKLFVPPAT